MTNLTEALGDRFPARGAGSSRSARSPARTVREAGLEVAVEADRHDVDGLLAALLADAATLGSGGNSLCEKPTARFVTAHFRRTGSTNTVARELAAAGAPHGTVVTAAEQTAGRGRQGRTWTAPPDSALLYSAVLRPLEPRHSVLPLAVALAVCETAEALRPGIECKVKWPNDVHLEGRKLAGILIEARPQDGWAVLGVGLNLTIAADEFPEELRDRAISLFARPSAVPYGAMAP